MAHARRAGRVTGVKETQDGSETSGNPTFIGLLIVGLSLFLALFHLYTGVFGTLNAMLQRSIHLGVALVLVFLIYPAKKEAKGTLGVSNYVFLALAIVSMGYLYWNSEYLTQERISMLTPATLIETALGICLISVVLEGVRRTLGMPLAIVVAVFIVYYIVGPYFPSDGIGYAALGYEVFIDNQYLSLAGMFGLALGISATFLPLFIIFGRIMNATGFGGFLTDFAMGVAGRTRGGPAKVAIISSALFGTINGSATANALTTGNFTIPLMKRSGYSDHFSAGVEASASTGGQIMPPIMGAAAFLMAEFARIPYVTIMQYAIFPAILFFLGIFVTVDLEAKKLRLKGLASDELPDWKSQVPKYLHLLVPIGILIWLIVENRSLMYSITVSIIALFVLAYLHSATRMNWRALVDALVASSRDILGVAMATAAVGIIVGIVGLTGLGIKLSSLMVDLSVGNLLASLLLAFLGAMVLGMTMNTSAVYLLLVALIIPGLLKVGLAVPQAHFFGFYFGVLAQVTPPVAVTAYAAAGLARADLNKTGYAAVKLCASGFVVPFMFAYSPELLLIGSWQDIAIAIPSAVIGVYVVSVAASAYWLTHMRWYERLVALGGALLTIFPGIWSDIIGLALIGVVLASQYKRVRDEDVRAARPDREYDVDPGVTK